MTRKKNETNDDGAQDGASPQPLADAVGSMLGNLAQKRAEVAARGELPAERPAPEGERCEVCGVVHRCTLCHDRERISLHDPADPVRSRYRDCPGDACREARRVRCVARLEETEVKHYREARFSTFNALPFQQAALDCARAFAGRTPPQGLLYLVGDNGGGKSHLAVATARAVAEGGSSVLFYRTTTLLEQMRASYDPEAPGTRPLMQLMAKLRDVACLVLDDFGQERMTKWSEELFFDLLDHRYVNWTERATVITSNVKLSELASSLGSRLMDVQRSQVCLLPAEVDLRARPLYKTYSGGAAPFNLEAEERRIHAVKDYVRVCFVCNCLPCHPDCPLTAGLYGDADRG